MWAAPVRRAGIRHGRNTTDPVTSTQHRASLAPIINFFQAALPALPEGCQKLSRGRPTKGGSGEDTLLESLMH